MTKLTPQHARDMGETLDRFKAPGGASSRARRMYRLHADALIEDAERSSIAGAADFVARPHADLTDAQLDEQIELTRQAPMPKLRRELDAEDQLRRFEDNLRSELSNLSADSIGHMLLLAELIDKTPQVIIAVNILEDELSYRGRPVQPHLSELREPAPKVEPWPTLGKDIGSTL